jgi:transposase
MAPQISTQLRERIVFWRYEQNKKAPEIALLAGCAESTVYEILRLYRDYGQITNPHRRQRGRPRTLNEGDMQYIYSILEANPTLYVDEIQQRLFETRDVEVSIATVSRALRRLAITHKHVAKEALERDELVHAAWQAEYGDIPMDAFVWVDEASVDDRTNQWRDGWALLGRACVRRYTFIRGQRFSILPALSVDGIIALDIFEGSVTKERFIRFIREQLVSYNEF